MFSINSIIFETRHDFPEVCLRKELGIDKDDGSVSWPTWAMKKGPLVVWGTWVFPKIVVPQNGWFRMENPIKMGWFGGTLFLETPKKGIILPSFVGINDKPF